MVRYNCKKEQRSRPWRFQGWDGWGEIGGGGSHDLTPEKS